MFSFLENSVGNNLTNDPADIRRTKDHLFRTGDFMEPDENDFLTRDLDDGIRSFQRNNDLLEDGKLFPGGETERSLFGILASRDAGEVFGLVDEANAQSGAVGFGGNVSGVLDKPTRPKNQRFRAFSMAEQTQDAAGFVTLGGLRVSKEKVAERILAQAKTSASDKKQEREEQKPVPEKKPIVPETTRPTFDVEKVPVFNNSKLRQQILLNDTPAKFEIKENLVLENPTFVERLKQTFVKDENFGSKAVHNHLKVIEKMSQKHGVEPDLVKSVMWAENARGHGFGTNDLADDLGHSESQAPMNISGEIWGGLLDKPGKKLNNDGENIEAGVILLKRIRDRIDNPTPEKIGSIWNSAGRENVNVLGKEIGEAYKNKPWEKKE